MCEISSKTQLIELWYVNYTNTYCFLPLLLLLILITSVLAIILLLFHSCFGYDIIIVTYTCYYT